MYQSSTGGLKTDQVLYALLCNTKPATSSKCLTVTLVVVSVVAASFTLLASLGYLGPIGSSGFIASVTTGGVIALFCASSLAYRVLNSSKTTQTTVTKTSTVKIKTVEQETVSTKKNRAASQLARLSTIKFSSELREEDLNYIYELFIDDRSEEIKNVHEVMGEMLLNYPITSLGETSLHLAIKSKRLPLAIWLFEQGASFLIKNNSQQTPLDYIIIHGMRLEFIEEIKNSKKAVPNGFNNIEEAISNL